MSRCRIFQTICSLDYLLVFRLEEVALASEELVRVIRHRAEPGVSAKGNGSGTRFKKRPLVSISIVFRVNLHEGRRAKRNVYSNGG